MVATLKPLKRTVGAAAAVAEALLERRGPALTRRLTPRERRVELTAAALFVATAAAMATSATRRVRGLDGGAAGRSATRSSGASASRSARG